MSGTLVTCNLVGTPYVLYYEVSRVSNTAKGKDLNEGEKKHIEFNIMNQFEDYERKVV